jgi:tetrahydromethanopterin S-methyltransferase subunit F
MSMSTNAEVPAAAEPTTKSGFFSTPGGRIVGIVVALGVLGMIAGIVFAVVMFVLNPATVEEGQFPTTPVTPSTESPTTTEATETVAAAAPAAEVANSEIFTFRDIFEPLIKPAAEQAASGGSTTETDTVTARTDDTLYLNEVITRDGELVAVMMLGDDAYELSEGESIPDSPWRVLRITSTQVTMLYGDAQVIIGVGEGITK